MKKTIVLAISILSLTYVSACGKGEESQPNLTITEPIAENTSIEDTSIGDASKEDVSIADASAEKTSTDNAS